MTEKKSAGKIPSILALLFVTLHVSAFVAVTVLQYRHVLELERNLSVRQADISDLTDSCGSKSRQRRQALHVFKRSLDELARKNPDFEVTWKLVNSRQTSSVSSLMSSVLHAQEQQLLQKCSGDVKICLSGIVGDLGTKGDKGTKGLHGAKGSEGPQGWKGETGNSGPKGLTGPSGAQGPAGGIGDAGDQGEKGSKGLKGNPGRKGEPGADGGQGPAGLKGETGDSGPQGVAAVYTGPVCDCIDKPYLSSSPSVISGDIGASLNLSCLADGSPPSTVTWYKISEPGCKFNGTSGNVLSIANLEPSDLGRYVCVASNSHGNASKIIDVTTTDSLNVLDCNFENQTFCHWTQSGANKMNMLIQSGNTNTPLSGLTVDHTLGTVSGRYLYFDTSLTSANQSSRIESMTVPANQDHCFTAWYNMYGRDIGSLQIYKKNCDNNVEQLLWNKAGNQGKGWHKVSFSLPAEPGNGIKLVIQATAGVGIQGDIAIDDLSLTDGPCAIPLPVIVGPPSVSITTTVGSDELLKCNATGAPSPTVAWTKPTSCRPFTQAGTSHSISHTTFADGGKYTCTATNTAGNTTKEIILKINGSLNCDFEQHDLCGWTSETANHPDTWLFHSGNTASSHTGPNNDHTTGSSRGVYLYMEASGRSPNDTVVMVSPNLPALNDVCLKFWYNMNGQEINSLNVYTKDCHGVKKTVLSYVGDKGEAWQESCTKVHPSEL
ncbi:MAM and LDL-receptor class A domain-containing protein 1-like [Pecten maximus]|uniref:MAM and LDL-receptor class A domain-containing protein 1-like n=1 Tax=Pecten maximus TaxID=6579 RepID=UPI001459062E|nr:MAM and LDL-receptor class A domain-containing protein 1-like [Pecten maximus]